MSFRLVALVAVALLAPSASAQLSAAPGPFAALGTAVPEQTLFRFDASPDVTIGYRLGGGLAVAAGLSANSRTRPFGPSRRHPAQPGDTDGDQTTTSRALSVAASARRPLGPLEIRGSASVALGRTTVETQTRGRFTDDGYLPELNRTRIPTSVGHGGLSAVVAIPIERKGGRMAPGLGVALATDRRLSGPEAADAAAWGAFFSVPTTVPVGPVGLTLDGAIGFVQNTPPGFVRTWDLSLSVAVRADL